MENKQPTQKEIEKKKETMRGYALRNLELSNLRNSAIAYFVDEDKSYGEYDNVSVDRYLYRPSLGDLTAYDPESGEEINLLAASRQGGKRYTGNEYGIIQISANIIQRSLGALKIEDIMNLFESKLKIKNTYKDKYISDLAESKNKEDQEIVQKLIGGYISYITAQGVSKALDQRAESIKGGLEKIVMEEPKK